MAALIALAAFAILGGLGAYFHGRFLARLKEEFPAEFERAGSPSQSSVFMPGSLTSKKYKLWLKTLNEEPISASVKRLFRLSQVFWMAAFIAWVVGIYMVM